MSKLKAPIQEKNSQALIEEAEKLYSSKLFPEAEYKYAEAIREAGSGLEKDYSRQLVCFQKLGDIYLGYKEYPKATALYNTALILAKDKFPDNKFQSKNQEQVQNNLQSNLIAKIKNTEKLFLRAALGKEIDETLVSPYGLDKEHKQHLVKLRNKCRKEIERIDREYNPYVKKGYDPLIPEIRALEIKRAEAINELYRTIATDIKSLIREMLKESYDVLGNPPCKYSIIALGSLAREEATPYSDFEWAILIEEGLTKEKQEEAREYFRNLTKLMHIKVINIGETILPSMHIKSLNDFYSKDQIKDNWYYDEIIPRGFGFDGLMPKACKIPLGTRAAAPHLRAGETDERNGKEIYELIRTPKEMAEFQNEKWYKQDNLLGNGMATFALIEGDEGLAKEYREEIEEVSKDLKDIKKKEILELLKRDIVTYDTRLDDPNEEGKLYEVKKEIYRLPDRTIDGIASYYNLKNNSSWDRINELEERGIINEEARDNLHIAVGIATEIRLRTYLKSDKQKETMNAIHLMFKAKEKLQESKEESKEEGTTEEELKEIFLLSSQEMLFRFYYTILPLEGNIRSSLSDKEMRVNQESNNNNNVIQLLGKHGVNIANKENNENNNLFDNGNLNKGLIYKRLLQYEKSKICFEKALEIVKTIYGTKHSEIASLMNNIGSLLSKLGRHKEALSYIEQAWHMRKNLYKHINNGNHPEIAASLYNLGEAHKHLGNIEKALDYHSQSLIMKRILYGEEHLEIASSLNNIGNILRSIREYEKAALDVFYLPALSIRENKYKNINNGDHPEVAGSLNNIAITLRALERYEEALEYNTKAFKMRIRIFGEEHLEVATSYNNMGIILRSLSRSEEALNYYIKALNIKKKVYTDHIDIVRSLMNAGDALEDLEQYEEALKYFKEALSMDERLYNDGSLQLKNKVAIVLYKIGNYREALEYYNNFYETNKNLQNGTDEKIIISQLNIMKCLLKLYGNEIGNKSFTDKIDSYLGKNISKDNVIKLISIIKDDYRIADFELALNCQKLLCTNFLPNDKIAWHNLACMFHVKALRENKKGNIIGYDDYLLQARKAFEESVNPNTEEKLYASLYTEYGMFLLKYYNIEDREEYNKIESIFKKAIELGDDGSGLEYDQLEAITTIAPIQELLEVYEKIAIKPYILAHYLVVSLYNKHNDKDAVNEALDEFKAITMSLDGKEEYTIALYLLSNSYKETGNLFEAKIFEEKYNKYLDKVNNFGNSK